MNSFESISPTAVLTLYPKIYTDIKYSKEIYNELKRRIDISDIKLNEFLAPEIEARYKLINKLLNDQKNSQILELAAGYSSRGMEYSSNGVTYIENDLHDVISLKREIISKFNSNSNIILLEYDVTDFSFSDVILSKIDTSKPLTILTEGLLRYLTWDEKRKVIKNIYSILSITGGCWITCDVTPKGLKEVQNYIHQKTNIELDSVTDRNKLNDRFENVAHVESFMKEIGFKNIEIHKFMEMKKQLVSFEKLNIDKDSFDELFERAIVAVIKI